MNLTDPVDNIPLVGPRYKSLLKKLDIETVENLLYHVPFRYEDFSKIKNINQLVSLERATIRVQVYKIQNITTKYGKRLTKATVYDETGRLNVFWFNQPFIIKNIKTGDQVSLSGTLNTFSGRPAFISPEYEVIKNDKKPTHTARIVPVYPETEGITSKWLRSRIKYLLDRIETFQIVDYLSPEILKNKNLIKLHSALRQVHFPDNWQQIEKARKRLAFNEMFLLQIKAFIKRLEWKNRGKAPELKISNFKFQISNFVDSLHFELTNAQKRCVDELLNDLKSNKPTNRLLEGDVGSGKTVVATIGMYQAFLNGYQSVLMAPTEALAQQHDNTARLLLEPFNLKIGLFTGTKKTLSQEKAKFDIFVGTHALLFDAVQFENVGFVIIDEQHRFGVKQRTKLIKKAKTKYTTPHLLTMTATPIPRTVALTFYGDLDLSVLDEMPPGRKKVKTFVVPATKRKPGEEWVKKKILEQKAQVFIICPLISDSEKLQVKAVIGEYKRLKDTVFTGLKLGLLHGQLGQREKVNVLTKFRKGLIDILVSTSVVEVGIDIPEATIMIIEGAERFGLASLHQLRGRVGRSDKESFCFLFTTSKSRKAYGRLKFMEKIHSGFKLAEIDLKLRGPGEIYGLKQHGLLNLKIASLNDRDLIESSRKVAKEILIEDPQLEKYPTLRDKIEKIKEVEPN